jgi:hypothetical protein
MCRSSTLPNPVSIHPLVFRAVGWLLSARACGLTGNFVFPRQATYTPASWQTGENVTTTPTGPSFETLTLSPCRLTIETRISKQLLSQSSDRSLDAFLKDSFLKNIGSALDAAALTGTGMSGIPLGLLSQTENVSGPPFDNGKLAEGVTFASGGPTWTSVLQMRYNTEIGDVVDDGTLGYILSPAAKLHMSQTQVIPGSNFPRFLYEDGKIADLPAKTTTNLSTTNQLIVGRWSDYLFALWGGAIDVFSDPISLAAHNQIRVVITCLANCGTLRGLSFCRSENSAASG